MVNVKAAAAVAAVAKISKDLCLPSAGRETLSANFFIVIHRRFSI
jgi:hypothetical protein